MALNLVAGSKLYIGSRMPDAPNRDLTPADFIGQDWVEIDGWTTAGDIGDTQEVVSQTIINRKRPLKGKGTSDAGNFENTFVPMPADPGQAAFKLAQADDCGEYAFRIDWSANCSPEGEVEISVGTPAVVTWAGHGLPAGSVVTFSNEGGALPTGLSADTPYYVLAAGLTANTFSVSATAGGTALVTTAEGTGTNTASGVPAGKTVMFQGLAVSGAITGGEANTAQLRNWSIAITSNLLEI